MEKSNHDFIGMDEAQEVTGLKKSTIYQLTSRKEIPHFRIRGGRLRFRRSELIKWIEGFYVPIMEGGNDE